MRPFYETSQQREIEDRIAARVAALRGLSYVTFPKGATIDRALIDAERNVRALLEIKTRTTPRDQYPTYCVSEERMNLFRLIAARLNVPALLVVQWADCCGVIDVRAAPIAELRAGGRTDRNDVRDVEPMTHYATSVFKILKNPLVETAA